MTRQRVREGGRRGEQGDPEQHQQAEPEGGRIQRRHAGHVAGRQAPSGVEMEPHRGPADERRTHVVRNDVAHEGGERGSPIRQGFADEPRGEGVVAGEYEVVERGERHRGRDAGRRQRAQRRDHLRPAIPAQLVREQRQGQGKEQQAEDRAHHVPRPLSHGYRLAAGFALHQSRCDVHGG
jgi:hypothetical protein